MTRYRIGVFQDENFVPTGCDGEPLPEPSEVYAQSPHCWPDGSEMSYVDYLQSYGDPRQHIGAAVVVERLDDDAVDWARVDSLWGIDVMINSPEAVAVSDTGTRWYRVTDLPPGYLGDVARELLAGVARQLGKPDLTSGQEMRR